MEKPRTHLRVALAASTSLLMAICPTAHAQSKAHEYTVADAELLTQFGGRANFSPDGQKIAFVGKTYGDAYEIDLKTRKIRNLTYNFPHQGIMRIQYLPNGNYLIQVGRTGYAFELTPDQEIVWEYKVPLKNGQPAPQGATLVPNDNITFEMTRYPADFPGFEGKDLSGKGWIETSPDSTFCSNILPTAEIADQARLKVYPNPAADQVTLEWDNAGPIAVEVLDLTGRPVMGARRFESGKAGLDVSGLPRGMYFLRVNGVRARKLLLLR